MLRKKQECAGAREMKKEGEAGSKIEKKRREHKVDEEKGKEKMWKQERKE